MAKLPHDKQPPARDSSLAEVNPLEAVTRQSDLLPLSNQFVVKSDTKAAIFDFDGTVANTFLAHEKPIRTVLEKATGRTFTDTEWEAVRMPSRGLTELDTCQSLLSHAARIYGLNLGELPSAEELNELRVQFLLENIENMDISAVAESMELIERLKAAEKKIALCTSSDERFVKPALKLLRLEKAFDAMVCSNDLDNDQLKPAPFPYHLALKRLNESRAIAFEDSCNGGISALAAGMTTCVRPSFAYPIEVLSRALQGKGDITLVDCWSRVVIES